MNPTLLAIETSTEACSVAASHGGRIESEHEIVPRQHNRWVLGMIERVLARVSARRSDLEAVAFGCGPGSFTGTRIAASVAQGLALALDCPVVRVPTPDVLAHTAWRSLRAERATPVASTKNADRGILAAIGSRAGEAYIAGYRIAGDELIRVIEPCIRTIASFAREAPITSDWVVAGDRCHEVSQLDWARALGLRPLIDALHPDARDLLELARHEFAAGRVVLPEAAVPVYLEGTTPWKKSARTNQR